MRTLLKILLIIALGAAAAFLLVPRMAADITETADAFFDAIKVDDLARAMEHVSVEFRSGVDEAHLREFLSRNGLLNFRETNWAERRLSGRRGWLEGSITAEYGSAIPIRLTFVRERGGWRMYSLQRLASGLMADDTDPRIPRPMERQMLVQQTMTDFALAVRVGSMADFHATLSRMGQDHYTVAMLDEAYGPIMAEGVDLTILIQVEPIFDGKPEMDDLGILTLKGHYPSFPRRVFFEQVYVHEGIRWKLAGFSINIE